MFDTDDGEWMIVHPDQIVATFLLPLPDPIALKDGGVLATYRGLDNNRVGLLEPVLDDLWMQRTDGSAVVPCQQMLSGDAAEVVVDNWSNKLLMHTSIQFHQTFSDAGLRLGLEPAIRVAKVISGPPLTLEEKVGALEDFNDVQPFDVSGLREMGIGAVSVAECVVNLRIVGDLPELSSPVAPSETRTSSVLTEDYDVAEEPTLWQWEVFDGGESPNVELVEHRLRMALHVALADLRSIQRGVHVMRRAPTAISTLERLPFSVPVVLRLARDVGDSEGQTKEILLITRPDAGPLPQFAPELIPDDEMQAFNKSRQRAEIGPLAAHADVYREAHIALDRLGDYRLAVLLFGIAAESLFDELLLLLMWEEGITPEQAAKDWVDGLQARLRTQLAGRIGGPWDLTGRNPIAAWAQHVASPRNRVAHAAYQPEMAEAHRSFEGVNTLVSHLCDRLASPEVRRRYPRTALMVAGEQGLQRRNSYTAKLRTLENDRSEVPWAETFHRWHEAWRRTRQDLTARPRVFDGAHAELLAVRHPDRSLIWVLHDRTLHLAVEAEVDEGDLESGFTDQLHTLADRHESDGSQASAISFAIEQPLNATVRPDATWAEEYHLVPLTEVMIDRSDLTQAR